MHICFTWGKQNKKKWLARACGYVYTYGQIVAVYEVSGAVVPNMSGKRILDRIAGLNES
jgi:hypothetical protein